MGFLITEAVESVAAPHAVRPHPIAGARAWGARRIHARAPLLVGLLAFALYLPGFWWGAPHATAPDRTHAWGVDDEAPLGPLSEMQGIIQPRAYENLGYPLMFSFMAAAAYAPYLGYLAATGQLKGVSAEYPFGLTDPATALKVLTWIAHLLSVLMAAVIVAAAYDAAERLWDRRTAGLAALFVMLAYPMFYYSRTGNVDVAVLCFTALALNAYARILVSGFSTRRALALGAAVGFALATKESASASFIGLPPVLLAMALRGRTPGRKWSNRPLAVAAGAAFLALGIGSGMFADPQRYFAHLAFIRERVNDLASGNVSFAQIYPRTMAGHVGLLERLGGYLVDSMSLPGLLLALVGLGWVARREPHRLLFALPAFTYFGVLFWSARAGQLRYLMPVAFTLAFFAARAVSYGWTSRHALPRYGMAALATIILTQNLLRGVDLTYAMLNDSRYQAGAWLAERTRVGDQIQYFGATQKLPPLAAGVASVRANVYLGAVARPRVDAAAVAEIRARWQTEAPRYIIIIPDHSSPPGFQHSASCPPEIYQDLLTGRLGYRLAATFQTPALLPWVKRPPLDYPSVNPPIRVFTREGS